MNAKTFQALALLALAACTQKPQAPATEADPAAPPTIDLRKERKDLLFTWADADGKLHDTNSAEQIPAESRKQVLVRDLSKSPDEVKADQYVFVADLTREENGAWKWAVVSRHGLERSLREGDFAPTAEEFDGGRPDVILYGTSWCGACAQARSWLKQKRIRFADKDIEKDEKAEAEMARKARRAGLQFGGVPVIDVRGKLMQGFDAGEIERLLASAAAEGGAGGP